MKFTVYEAIGAMNVPGRSKHRYQLRVPATGDPYLVPQVVSVLKGQKVSDGVLAGTPGGLNPTVLETTVFWDPGKVVGKVRMTPGAAVSNFFTHREVNVVAVAITDVVGAHNMLEFKGPPTQYAIDPNFIDTFANGAAMTASLRVTDIDGPKVGNAKRGARFLEAGFIQNVTVTGQNSFFYQLIPDALVVQAKSMQGNTYLDSDAAVPGVWYTDPDGLGVYPIPNGTLPDAGAANIDYEIHDSPLLSGTSDASLELTVPLGNGFVTDVADRFNILVDFALYFAVRTKEETLGSEAVYTQRGRAYWHVDASGTIDANKQWTLTGNGTGDGTTSGQNTGKYFVLITDGSVVPVTVNPKANAVNATWTWSIN